MTDQPVRAQSQVPLGIVDLYATTTQHWPDHWYWCRLHEKAEHADEPTHPVEDCLPTCTMPGEHVHRECIRVGPFMSEREALRLTTPGAPYGNTVKHLSMEVEQ